MKRYGLLLLLTLCVIYPKLQAQSQVPATARRSTAAQVSAPTGQAPKASRLIVKLRPEFADGVEAALPGDMVLNVGAATSQEIRQFMAHFSTRSMAPLYPDIVSAKRQRRISGREFALSIRDRFRTRALRLDNAFNPPDISRTYLLQLSTVPQELPRVLAQLKADPRVEFAEIDDVASITYTPNDPYFLSSGSWGQSFDDMWGIKRVNAPAAWDVTAGQGITVAVVDTGLDISHLDIAANVWTNTGEIKSNGIDDDGNGFIDDANGWNFVSSSNYVKDDHGHGTHVSGTIAAVGNNGIGVIGVAWRAKIMPMKALDAGGWGSESGLAAALIYAANNGADVINNSWRMFGTSQTISDAVSYAHNMGSVVIAAAGNESMDTSCCTPADRPEAITVAASTPYDTLAYFSNYGEKVDIAAPGESVLSLRAAGTAIGMTVGTDYTVLSGTSMAAPHASGVAALILAQHPGYSNEQVRQVMRMSASEGGSPGYDPYFGYGVLNGAQALSIDNALEARIVSPSTGMVIHTNIEIRGFARGNGFSSFVLEYGIGELPAQWTVLQTSSTPSSDLLGAFDATSVADGAYVIRLTAYNTSGTAFVDRVRIVVKCADISNPIAPQFPTSANTYKPGSVIPLEGIAVGSSFDHFEIQWARGLYAVQGWRTDGITLSKAGLAPVAGGVLAKWDTTGIVDADYYTVRLIVHRGELTNETHTTVYLQPDLLSPNWPRFIENGPNVGSGVVPALDANAKTRLLVSSIVFAFNHPALWTLSPDGASVSKFMIDSYGGSWFQPSVADVDGIAGEEVIFADTQQIHAFRQDGSSLQYSALQGYIDYGISPLVIEDLDGDSHPEIIAFGTDLQTQNAHIYAWRSDGSLLNSSFPITIEDNNDGRFWRNQKHMLVIDFDGDGKKEIAVTEGLTNSSFQIRLFTSRGVAKTWDSPVFDGMPGTMVAADLDHDRKLEILLLSHDVNETKLHVLRSDGTERVIWSGSHIGGTFVSGFVAVGDVDLDGFEDIALTYGNFLFLLDMNGMPHSGAWPFQVNANDATGASVIGDVDGDGQQEIVTVTNYHRFLADPYSSYVDQKLVVIRSDGTVQRSWQLTGRDGYDLTLSTQPTIGDFDQDGKTDLAIAYPVTKGQNYSGIVAVFRTGSTYNPSLADWPMYLQNSGNTGTLPLRDNKVGTSVLLTSSANPAGPGESVTLKAKVSILGTASSAPSGVVEFYDGNAKLAIETLNDASEASTTVSDLSVGVHTITAKYMGSAEFFGNYSPSIQQTMMAEDFAINGGDARTVRAGQTASFTITVSGDPGTYSSPVGTFSCTGLPRGTACHFNPTSVTPGDTNTTVELSISTTARTVAALAPISQYTTLFALTLSGSFVAIGVFVMPSFRRFRAPILLVIACAAMLVSCGGGGGSNPPPPQDHGTPAGTYTITVSAIGEGVTHTTTVTMTVQ